MGTEEDDGPDGDQGDDQCQEPVRLLLLQQIIRGDVDLLADPGPLLLLLVL